MEHIEEKAALPGAKEAGTVAAREREPRDDGVQSPASGQRLSMMFQQNFSFIWRMLRRLGVPDAAVDDAAQQVFLVSTRKVDSIAEGSERAFLFSTAMRVAAEARRTRAIGRESPSEDLDLEAHPTLNAEELVHRKRNLQLLDGILEQLPPELRTVFVLFELDGMSTHDIAPLLGLPRGTVASRLRRARDEFQAIARRVRAKAGFLEGKHE